MYLLDTPVVWALRAIRQRDADPAMIRWAEAQMLSTLFVSALTLAELGAGAVQVEKADKAGAATIRRWIDGPLMSAFEGRILSLDATTAQRAAALGLAHIRDGMVAATALEHSLTIATRTPAAYRLAKVRTVDPWSYSARAEGDDGDWRQASRSGPVWLKNFFARG